MHLAEHRAEWPGKKKLLQGCPIIDDNRQRVWWQFEALDYGGDDFETCGQAFETAFAGTEEVLVSGRVGLAECRLMSQVALVDFAAEWLSKSRYS